MHILTCSCNNGSTTHQLWETIWIWNETQEFIESIFLVYLHTYDLCTITYLPAYIRHVARLQSVACLQVRHSGTRYNALMAGDGGLGNLGIGDTKNDNLMIDNREPWGGSIYTSQLSDSPRAPPPAAHGETGRNYSESFVNCFPSIHGGSIVLGPRQGAAPYIPRQIARWEMTF